MAEIIVAFISYLKSHISVLIMGFLGASLSVLLSKEKYTDRLVGALAGFILCIAFAEHASQILANGKYPEVFGFLLGAMGKGTAETLLQFMRSKFVGRIKGDDDGFSK